jgi:hypothetical protein
MAGGVAGRGRTAGAALAIRGGHALQVASAAGALLLSDGEVADGTVAADLACSLVVRSRCLSSSTSQRVTVFFRSHRHRVEAVHMETWCAVANPAA